MVRHLVLATALLCLCHCAHNPIAIPSEAVPFADASRPDQRVTCTNDKDTRLLEIKLKPQGGCELTYTKYGMQKSIAIAPHGNGYCREVSTKITSNLAKSGFICE